MEVLVGSKGLLVVAALGEMKPVAANNWATRSEVWVAICAPYISGFGRGNFSLISQKMRLGGGFVQEEIGKWWI